MRPFIAVLSALILVLCLFGTTQAETENKNQDRISIWIPPKMLKGETYRGLVVVDTPPFGGTTVSLSSNNDHVKIPKTVAILQESNHGMFPIKPLLDGTSTIFAASSGESAKATTKIYSSASKPYKLEIFLPSNSTAAESMIGYVFSLDANGVPVPINTAKDTRVDLIPTHMIDVPETITIKKKQYYAKFECTINGDGNLSANAKGLKPASVHLTQDTTDIRVKLGIAPNIALSNSQVHFYVWLEKDGTPFSPKGTVDVFLTSDNSDVASTTYTKQDPPMMHARMVDGIAKGLLYTGNQGRATISANVEGFGSSKEDIIVGPVAFPPSQDIDDAIQNIQDANIQYQNSTADIPSTRKSRILKPDLSLSWAFPQKTSGVAYGITATYLAESNQTITSLIPVFPGDRIFNVNSQKGLEHKEFVSLYDSYKDSVVTTKPSAIEYKLLATKTDTYKITSSSPGIKTSKAVLSVVPDISESYDLNVVTLPFLAGKKQDIAIMSLVDRNGNMVPAKSLKDTSVFVNGVEAKTNTYGNTLVVNHLIHEESKLVILGESRQKTVPLVPARTTASLAFDFPKNVHSGEKAPFAIHTVDSIGVPLEKISSKAALSTTPNLSRSLDSDTFFVNGPGIAKASVISDLGVASGIIESFSNNMNLEITSNTSKARVGNPVRITVVTDVTEPELDIESPFSKISESRGPRHAYFLLYPDKEGKFEVTVTAKKKGYNPATKTIGIHAKEIYDLSVNAKSGNTTIPITFTLDANSTYVAPFSKETRPSEVSLSLPLRPDVGAKTFLLKDITVSKEKDGTITPRQQILQNSTSLLFYIDDDTKVTASYERVVKIDVKNAQGGGLYQYGSNVTLSAPPKEKLSFLVRQVFDHWEGLPYETETVSFVAKQHVTARAVYKDDYTFLMLIIAISASCIFVIKSRTSLIKIPHKVTSS